MLRGYFLHSRLSDLIENTTTFFKIKTPLCCRLKERHLDVCCKAAIDGPNQEVFEYKVCIRRFYRMKVLLLAVPCASKWWLSN